MITRVTEVAMVTATRVTTVTGVISGQRVVFPVVYSGGRCANRRKPGRQDGGLVI